MSALIALILANLPTIIQAGEAGYKFVTSVRTATQQTGEWTDDHEAEFQAKIANEAIDPAWQLDAPAPDMTLRTETVTDQAEPPAPAPKPAPVEHPQCATCGTVCAPNSPNNCNCNP